MQHFRNKLNMKKEIWTEIGKSYTFLKSNEIFDRKFRLYPVSETGLVAVFQCKVQSCFIFENVRSNLGQYMLPFFYFIRKAKGELSRGTWSELILKLEPPSQFNA